jgi:Uma2 family endonuclease
MAPQDILVRPLTKTDFLAFMATEPEGCRYEFVHGEIIAMPGGSRRHSIVGTRFLSEIDKQIDPDRWTLHGSDRSIDMPDTVRYPDVVIDTNTDDDFSRWTEAPLLAVEVLSPSTKTTDLGAKAAEYRAVASLQAYIVAEPVEPRCYVWLSDDTGHFPAEPIEISGPIGVVDVPALGISIALSAVYRHVLKPR